MGATYVAIAFEVDCNTLAAKSWDITMILYIVVLWIHFAVPYANFKRYVKKLDTG